MLALHIVQGGLDDPRVTSLLQAHVTRARAETARGSAHALDLSGLRAPDITFWSAWDDSAREALLAVAAMRALSAVHGEVKSMHTAEAVRGRGIGAALLRHIIAHAESRGMTRLSLETGAWPYFAPARALYAREGFVECDPFGDYRPDPNSVFMTLSLPRSAPPHSRQEITMPPSATAAPIMSSQQFLEHWQGHRALTRRVIDAFPDDKLFTFSVGGMRPFSGLAMEFIGMAVPTLNGVITGNWAQFSSPKATNKAELLRMWDDATVEIDTLWPTIPAARFQEVDTAFGQWKMAIYDLLLYVRDNEIHHRGQGYVYLRSLGIEPPPFWERS